MTTFRTLLRHRADADHATKRKELLNDLPMAIYELLECGATESDIESAVECAVMDYESDQVASEAAS